MEWNAESLRRDGFAPIGSYAAIGDGRTAALVAADGTIDWMSAPRFDSEPVFGALLDPGRAGRFVLRPEGPFTATRAYVPDTNVLETTFRTATGAVRVRDALTLTARMSPWTELARVVEGVEGEVPMRWEVVPRIGWAARPPLWTRHQDVPVAECGGALALTVHAWDAGEPSLSDDALRGAFTARAGERAVLAMGAFANQPLLLARREDVEARIEETVAFWKTWIEPLDYDGPYREAVCRSALALGLCLHRETGALVAAPTTSLPEQIGGPRNWDYRYCWLRDTGLALDAFVRLGLRQLDHTTLSWVLEATRRTHPRLAPCYTLDAAPLGRQQSVDVPGWRHSTPVYDGNQAGGQLQLGSWGDLMETIWHYVRVGNALDHATGVRVAELADHLTLIWRNADAGIWETGDDQRDYTRSKVSAWMTLERTIALHELGEVPTGDPRRWAAVRDEIRAFVEDRCWSGERRTWLRDGDGSGELDASTLLLGRVGFSDERRLSSTIDAIRDELGAGGPLLFRATKMMGKEGAFIACSFWLVDALARCGRLDEAHEVFDGMLAVRNDVGLLSEEVDPSTGELLGNIPQGLSHLSLISAATALDEAERAQREGRTTSRSAQAAG
ncbi:MAG TPA: glycoside hydrolase family 15 protein [Baekduia sp.]|nr:glycoside hydrolase family 15 protein [Baekduia sp.]